MNANSKQRTYVGITNNMNRRLRQHNGELVGGAKATRISRPWDVWITVEGFPTQTSSLQFEWMWKHMAPKKSHGKKARITKLRDLLNKEQWTAKSPLAKTIPLKVTIYDYRNDDDDDDDDHIEKAIQMDPWEMDLLTTTTTTTTTTCGSEDDVTNILPEYVQVRCVNVNVVVREEEEEEEEEKVVDKDWS